MEFEYQCEHGNIAVVEAPIGQAPTTAAMEDGCQGQRLYSFMHCEDRRHMRSGISPVTGEPYATSRGEERIIEKMKGIEFVGKSDMPNLWKDSIDYANHVKSGGNHVPYEPPKPKKGWFMEQMRSRGYRFS